MAEEDQKDLLQMRDITRQSTSRYLSALETLPKYTVKEGEAVVDPAKPLIDDAVSRIRGTGPAGNGIRGKLQLRLHKATNLHQKKEGKEHTTYVDIYMVGVDYTGWDSDMKHWRTPHVTATDKCPVYDQEYSTRLVSDHPFRVFLRFSVFKVRLGGLKKIIGDHLSSVDKNVGETVLELSKWDLRKKIELECNLTVSHSLSKTGADLGQLHLTLTWIPSRDPPPKVEWPPVKKENKVKQVLKKDKKEEAHHEEAKEDKKEDAHHEEAKEDKK